MNELCLEKPVLVTNQIWDHDKLPVVSVFSWTYNHVNFIRESIESILEQKTTFPIEIIIHDDASTDGAIDIIREYETKYPRLFRNIIQKENQWSQGKSVMDPMFREPHGKYIALTHGDDYWTDPFKLQKQVDYLELHETCEAVFHNSKIITNQNIIGLVYNQCVKDITIQDLFFGQYMKTCTLMFRNNINKNNFEKIVDDTTLGLVILDKPNSYAHFVNETMSVYRVHEGGIESQVGALQRYNLSKLTLNCIQKYYSSSYSVLVSDYVYEHYRYFSYSLLKEDYYVKSFYCFLQVLKLENTTKVKFKYFGSYLKHLLLTVIKLFNL